VDGSRESSFREASLVQAIDYFLGQDAAASRSVLRSHLAASPSDPLGHSISAALDFYGAVIPLLAEAGHLSVGSIRHGPALELPLEQVQSILARVERAETFAAASLQHGDTAVVGFFALALASSVRRDYLAFIGRRWSDSLEQARAANRYGRKLLQADSNAHDAYFFFACSEYLVFRLPAVARIFATIPGISGRLDRAMKFLEVTSRSGCYLQNVAAIFLAFLYADEKRIGDSRRLMDELSHRLPGGERLARELERLLG
jgi:hypothetical protein